MTRALPAGLATAIASEESEIVHLIEITTSGGVTRMATSAEDIVWAGEPWPAVGGLLQIGAAQETSDDRAQSMDLRMSGVDGSAITLITDNETRGRPVRIWRAHIAVDGTIVQDPLLLFSGLQTGAYEVRESRRAAELGAGTVEVRTRIESRLAALSGATPTRTNPTSHNAMLVRAGVIADPDTDRDIFFATVARESARILGPRCAGPRLGRRQSWRWRRPR